MGFHTQLELKLKLKVASLVGQDKFWLLHGKALSPGWSVLILGLIFQAQSQL